MKKPGKRIGRIRRRSKRKSSVGRLKKHATTRRTRKPRQNSKKISLSLNVRSPNKPRPKPNGRELSRRGRLKKLRRRRRTLGNKEKEPKTKPKRPMWLVKKLSGKGS